MGLGGPRGVRVPTVPFPLPGGIQHLVAMPLVGAQGCALVWVPELQGLVAAAGQAVVPVHWGGGD